MNEDVDDGSTKPLGHQTNDGELEVREQDGERMYHETDLGQHMRWMRQAPDLFEKYQALQHELSEERLRCKNATDGLLAAWDVLRAYDGPDEHEEIQGGPTQGWIDAYRKLMGKMPM